MIKRIALTLVLGLVAGLGVLAPQNAAALDVYITPGIHNINGRQWKTECSPYSSTVTRCRTEIWATVVTLDKGKFVQRTGWHFNNLTYAASPRADWSNNNLGRNADWTSTDGRYWYTQCDNPTTGSNGCRTYIWTEYVTATKVGSTYQYSKSSGWVMNNMVRFSTDYYQTVSGNGGQAIYLPAGTTEVYVRATHTGPGAIEVIGHDGNNAEIEDDGYLWLEGDSAAGDGFGVFSDAPRSLWVNGEGDWTLVIKPLSAAPRWTGATMSGVGTDMFWYFGDAGPRNFTNVGVAEVWATQVNGDEGRVLLESVGNQNTTVDLLEGPSIIWVSSDGTWSFS